MEWILSAVGTAFVGLLLGEIWMHIKYRWRQRAEPLTNAGVSRFHRSHFRLAVAMLVYAIVLLLYVGFIAAQSGLDVWRALAIGALGALCAYLWRVSLRRWRRLQEHKRSPHYVE